MTIPIPLQEALKDSITSGSFVDTKFWLFSKRRSNPGRVGVPKALFVNGRVAKRIPCLGALLDECKNKENLRTRFPENRKPYTSNYDYEEDSDLEEDDDDDIPDDEDAVAPQVVTEKSRNESPELVTVGNPDTKSNESSDIISVSDLDSLFLDSPDTKDEVEPAHVGKAIIIEDVAFVTFQALLRYLYTNEIEFAPWGSTERREVRALEPVSESYGIPKPSPKSIYRLAEKYDIPELKELALGEIQQELFKCSIVDEVFSKYTSWYSGLRKLEVRQLARTLLPPASGRNLEALKEKINSYTRGQLPHAKHVISALYELMESDEPVEEIPLPVPTSSNQQASSRNWAGLKKALTSSLTSGTFLDSQFYAVESRSSTGLPKIRPMYFCSMVDDSLASKLMTCSSKLNARKVSVGFAGGYDSDIEDEKTNEEHSTDRYPSSKCIRESPTSISLPLGPALMLNYGAAKTWSAIFLYVYTGQVAFSSIGSQGITYRETHNGQSQDDEAMPPQDQGGFHVLPLGVVTVEPCSPKSIYSLANKVGLTGLCDTALDDIQSKLDEINIIEELFSSFTADHKDVREMEFELFRSRLKPLVNRTLIPHMIEESSSGKHPHRAVAMGLILEKSIQERYKRELDKVQDASPLDSTSQPERSTETPTSPIPHVQPLSPVPTPQPLSQSSSSSEPTPASTATETAPDSPTLPEPGKDTKVGHLEEPPENTGANPPRKHTVKLVCKECGATQPLFTYKFHGLVCPRARFSVMMCSGCETKRVGNGDACTNCHGKFER